MTEAQQEALAQQAIPLLRMLQQGPAQGWLTNEKYFELFDSAVDWAKKCIEDDGSAPHVFYLHGRHVDNKDDWIMLPVMFGDWPPPDGKKYDAMQGLGVMFTENHPDHMLMEVVHVSESWLAEYAPEDVLKNSAYLPKGIPYPSARDDKIECITISANTMDQRMSAQHLEIVRDAKGDFAKWGRVLGKRYDPKDTSDPRDQIDYLSLNIYMGYFAASKRTKKRS